MSTLMEVLRSQHRWSPALRRQWKFPDLLDDVVACVAHHGGPEAAARVRAVLDLGPGTKPMGYWTFERVQAEALKYKTRSAFVQGSLGAYQAALRKGWLDRVCSHMTIVKRPDGYWTFERVQAEALKWKTRTAFARGHSSAYSAACDNGWLDQVCGHMAEMLKPDGYWTFERVQAEALKFPTRNAFRQGHHGAYKAAHRYGWLDQVCAHMTSTQKPMRYWTFERIHAEALKYENRTAFEKGSPSAYSAARKSGRMDELCSHMTLGRASKWTFERVQAKALKYKSRTAFSQGAGGAYRAAKCNDWLDRVCKHMNAPVLRGALAKRAAMLKHASPPKSATQLQAAA